MVTKFKTVDELLIGDIVICGDQCELWLVITLPKVLNNLQTLAGVYVLDAGKVQEVWFYLDENIEVLR